MRIIILLFFAQISFAQFSGIIKDSKTKEPISYVNIVVENQNIGTSANEGGIFSLPKLKSEDVVVFSAVGYKMLKINAEKFPETIYLEQQVIDLKEFTVIPRKGEKEFVLGKINKKEINSFFSNSGLPNINGKYFPFLEDISETKYIKKIKVLTKSDIKSAAFNIRLYTLDKKGEPKEYYSEKNIIGYCTKGKKITEISIESLDITFPESGLLVCAEWLIINQNKNIQKYTEKGSKVKKYRSEFQPSFGGTIEPINNSWVKYTSSRWFKQREWPAEFKNYKGKYHTLAVEVVLTN